MYHEVGDVWTELGMGEEPFVAVFVATEEECGCQQKEGCGREYGKKGSEDSESQSYESQYCKKPLHYLHKKRVS